MKHFGMLDIEEVVHWLIMRILWNFENQKIWKENSEIPEI
jgi:hypothetical protein